MEQKKALFFLAKFFAIFLVLEALIYFIGFSALKQWLAGIEAGFLGLQAQGNIIGGFEIGSSCTGLVSIAILAGIVFGLRKPELKKKILVFAIGAVALLIVNIARVFLVLWIGQNIGLQAAETAHVISWFAMTAVILALWLVLTKKIAKEKELYDLL